MIKMKKKLVFILIAVVVVVVALARTTMNIQQRVVKKAAGEKGKEAAISFEEEATPVKVYKVKKTDFRDSLPAIGNVKGYREVDLRFQASGIIESYNFEEGEKIQEGDIIASLDQRDALLKLKYSEVEYKKNQKLFEVGAINQMKLDQAKLEYESAKSDLDKTNIYALSNGVMGSKLIEVGSYVNTGTTDKVGVFVSMDKVYTEFGIIEKDIPKVNLGQKAEIYVDAYPTKTYNGTVDRILPIIEGRSRTETIKIEVDNKEGFLKPGMFVRALIYTYEKKDALVIPSSALKKKEADYFVYVVHKEEPKKEEAPKTAVKEKKKGFNLFGGKKKAAKVSPKEEAAPAEKPLELGTVEVRKVKLGYMTQDLVEVDEGLAEDDLIIVEAHEEYKDKAKVEIAEVQEGLV